MMPPYSIALAIFVKTPGLTPFKTRLAKNLGEKNTEEFYRASLKITAEIVIRAQQSSQLIQPYWAVTEPEALQHKLWQQFPTVCSDSKVPEQNLGHRIAHVFNTLISKYQGVIIIGADSPQLEANQLSKTAQQLDSQTNSCIFGPSLDGGFYLFASNQPVKNQLWQQCTYSSSKTYQQLKQGFDLHYSVQELQPLQDVDEFDDLCNLVKYLEKKASLNYSENKLLILCKRLVQSNN